MAKSIIKNHQSQDNATAGGTGSHNRKKKVSFGPCVMVKEIPFYNEEERIRMFYTDQEYDLFEVAEQQRLLGIRLLLEEYKLQRRMLTLQRLMDAERTAMSTIVNTTATTSMSRKRDCSKMMEQSQGSCVTETPNDSSVSSQQEQREEYDCSDCVLSTGTLNRRAKRRRTTMMKLSAFAA